MKFNKNQDNLIVENTPVIKGAKCKAMVYSLYFCITIVPLLISIYVWYEYDFLLGVGIGLFLYLVSAIVVSKLRVSSLPRDQYERSLSFFDVSKWYIKTNHCLDE